MPSKKSRKTNTQTQPSFYHTSIYPLTIAPSNIKNAGQGVFTNAFIPEGTIIDEYFGDIYEISYASSRYFLEITPTCGIDAFNFPRCYMAMINDVHSTHLQVNCEFIIDKDTKRAFIKSIIDIPPNSELYVSYGEDYWRDV